jgi:hypothetical protein
MGGFGTVSLNENDLPPYFEFLGQAWITSNSFGAIFQNLRTSSADPQVIVISGIELSDGTVQLTQTYFAPAGVATPVETGATGLVTALGDGGAVVGQASFLGTGQLQYISDDGSHIPATIAPFVVQLPISGTPSTVQVSMNGTVATSFSPAAQLLTTAISEIPDTSFFDQRRAAWLRSGFLAEAQSIERELSECARISANAKSDDKDRTTCLSRVLEQIGELRAGVERDLNNSSLTTSPMQMTKGEVIATIDFTIALTIPNRTARARDHAFRIKLVPDDFSKIVSLSSVTQSSYGSAEILKDGYILYTPKAKSPHSDSFTVTLSTTEGASVDKTVTVIAPAKHGEHNGGCDD